MSGRIDPNPIVQKLLQDVEDFQKNLSLKFEEFTKKIGNLEQRVVKLRIDPVKIDFDKTNQSTQNIDDVVVQCLLKNTVTTAVLKNSSDP